MWQLLNILLLGSILQAQSTIWSCLQDSDCSFTSGAVCSNSSCICPGGQQLVVGGTACVEWSPYHTSPCVEDFQCARLVTNYQCRSNGTTQGNCHCRDGSHYLFGRCWRSSSYGGACTRDEDCLGALRDPFSLACNKESGVCECATGYYRRQRGECRKIGGAVGDGCVLNEDCQFQNGACDMILFTCYDSSNINATILTESQQNDDQTHQSLTTTTSIRQNPTTTNISTLVATKDGAETRQFGATCDANNACASPFVCTSFGLCACPSGYYSVSGGNTCYAELGSPSTEDQCIGFLAEVIDGICTCRNNFYYSENMRDCVKVVRAMSDSCISDESCHTFGSAVRCGPPTGDWGLRSCQCIPELAVWDQGRNMCRLFAGVGESCQVSSDCLAGNLEIECVLNEEGVGTCRCPEGTVEQNGLCLTAGLDLGDACQVSQECTATSNSGCYDGVCKCESSYEEINGVCVPSLGGACTSDADCKVLDNLVCARNESTGNSTCQCATVFLEYGGRCWAPINDADSTCNVTVQCTAVMGEFSACRDSKCVCADNAHYRDDRCWPRIGLFQTCSRTSQCYLQDLSNRVECRNSLCQCSFDYPYSEQLQTCTGHSASTTTLGSLLTIILALNTLYLH